MNKNASMKRISLGPVIHLAFVVENLEQAINGWVEVTGAGPFFIKEDIEMHDVYYKGNPVSPDFRMRFAIGYLGEMGIELIQQLTDTPFVYKDLIDEKGGGWHHIWLNADDYHAEIKKLESLGGEIAMEGAFNDGSKFCYVDTTATIGGMVELMQIPEPIIDALHLMKSAHKGWNRQDPVRAFPAI